MHVDNFSTLHALTTKQRGDPEAVLAALRTVSRISCWDMETGGLWKTIKGLEAAGRIKVNNGMQYPWIGVQVLAPTA